MHVVYYTNETQNRGNNMALEKTEEIIWP